MGFTRPVRRRALALAVTTALTLTAAAVDQPAQAAGSLPTPVPNDPLPTTQIDGVVWTQAVVGTTVYAGGSFRHARPAGAAPGVNEVPRTGLLAYDVTTGVLKAGFHASLNGQVRSIAASPDGSRIYIAGDFTTVDGQPHNRVAALDPSTGNPIASFAPDVNGIVKAVAATSGTVYLGGVFTAVDGVTRSRAAAVSAVNGAVTSFAPAVADYSVYALAIAPDRSKVVLAGSFSAVNGQAAAGMAAANPDTGAAVTWRANTVVYDSGSSSAIYSLSSNRGAVYGTGYNYQGAGNFEGTVAMNWSDGGVRWLEDCHGDTYSSVPFNGAVYTASHAHYCGNIGGFQETDPRTWHRALAFSQQATGTVQHNTQPDYADFGGQPAPTLLDWYPNLTPGSYTGASQAAWSVAAGGSYLVYGGEFTAVNGTKQQGLVRFRGQPEAPAPGVSDPGTGPTDPGTTDPGTGTGTGDPAAAVPNAVAKPSVAALGTTVLGVRWSVPKAKAHATVTGYRIRLAAPHTTTRTVSVKASARLAVIRSLKRHTTYTVTVAARSTAGYGKASPSAVRTTRSSGPTLWATKVPSRMRTPGGRATGRTQLAVTWKAASVTGATAVSRYEVRVYVGTKLVKTVRFASTRRSGTVTGLKAHTGYRIGVRAANWAGWGATSPALALRTRS